jgi:hypothetical protein
VTLPPNIAAWPPLWREAFEERAAVMEFDAKLSRDQAELLAESEVRREADQTSTNRRTRCAQIA